MDKKQVPMTYTYSTNTLSATTIMKRTSSMESTLTSQKKKRQQPCYILPQPITMDPHMKQSHRLLDLCVHALENSFAEIPPSVLAANPSPLPLPSIRKFVYKFLVSSRASLNITQLALFYLYKFVNEMERIDIIQIEPHQLDSVAYSSYHVLVPSNRSLNSKQQQQETSHTMIENHSLSSSKSSNNIQRTKKVTSIQYLIEDDNEQLEMPHLRINTHIGSSSTINTTNTKTNDTLSSNSYLSKLNVPPMMKLDTTQNHEMTGLLPLTPPLTPVDDQEAPSLSLPNTTTTNTNSTTNTKHVNANTSSNNSLTDCDLSKPTPTYASLETNETDMTLRRALKLTQREELITQCSRRIFLGCLIIANKYHKEPAPSNIAWSSISNLSTEELGYIERTIFKVLDYDLFVSRREYDRWSRWCFQGLFL